MFSRAAKARKPFDVEWVLDVGFYLGRQHIEYYTDARGNGRFQDIPGRLDKLGRPQPRAVANKVYSLVMDAYAMVKQHDPAVEVLPQNVDSMELSNARVAQAYLDHLCFPTQADWRGRRNEALFWTVLVGEGWIKACMDDRKGRPTIEARSPFSIYLDPTPSSHLDCRWIIDVQGMDPEEVYDRFGVEMAASDVDSQDALKMKILREIGMVSGNPTVTVKELWELPGGRRHPKGRHVIWAANRVLLSEPFPYKHSQLPFAQIGHSPIPGVAHYTSGTRIARPLQMELNQYHTQKLIARKKFNNFKVVMDSAVDLEVEFDDSADQILRYDSEGGRIPAPTLLQAQMWPDPQDGIWIGEELDDAVGIHDASRGMAPGRVDSASGIEQLQEADRGRFSEVEATHDRAVARIFGQLLELAKQYVSGEQIVADYSQNGAPQVRRFQTDQFPDKPMLRVVSGGGLPKNRTAKMAQVTSMFASGILGDPAAPPTAAKALKMLDFPSEMNLSGEEIDEMEARAENLLMLAGTPVTPKKWQNHELHRRIHDEARKSSEFASATEAVWSTFEFHLDATDAAELEEIHEEAHRQAEIQRTADEAIAAVEPIEPAPADAPLGATPTPPEAQSGPPLPGPEGAPPACPT